VFEAKEGEVSPLYECGDNDHLMVVALEKINKEGYRNINLVKDMLKAEIIKDKKAEQLMAQLKGVSSIDQAKGLNGAVSDTVKHITFSAPTYVAVTRASEPALGAAANKAELNKLSAPVKGYAGVYVMQVINRENSAEKFDAKQEAQSLTLMASRYASAFINDLYKKANVKDDRYLFF
jgi:peptidyl-prolyl cis-trans isomerase D